MRASSKRFSQAGYSVVELMMALAIFSVGVTGITAMQSVTASANRFAKNMSVATSLARSWQDRLAMDATRWGGTSAVPWALANTAWLKSVPDEADDAAIPWLLPANDADAAFGPGADAKGQFVNYSSDADDVVFCTHMRLTRLINEASRPGSGLIRADIRVFWPKDIAAWNGGANYCDDNASITSIGADTASFHFVYQSSVVRETPAF